MLDLIKVFKLDFYVGLSYLLTFGQNKIYFYHPKSKFISDLNAMGFTDFFLRNEGAPFNNLGKSCRFGLRCCIA